MPGLENQECGLKNSFIPRGTLSTHPVAPKKWTCHMSGKIYNLDRSYTSILSQSIILILPEAEEAMLFSLGHKLD